MISLKSNQEIELMQENGCILAAILDKVKHQAKPGVSTLELAEFARELIEQNDAESAFFGFKGFPGQICLSVNEEVVHGIPSSRKLKDGDIVSIDVGVLKEGYYGDAALSFIVGSVKPECERLLQITEESLYKGIEEARCDNRVEDISFAIQDHVEANGYSVVRELTGHGVGRFLHEDPSIPNFGKKGRGSKLRSGMTLAIEPMVNMGKKEVHVKDDGWTIAASDGLPSAHFEHTILVANKEAEILTVT